jgi:2'-5' RNA ligase
MSDPKHAGFHRLFVALPVPRTVKAEIEKGLSELRNALPDVAVRWTRREHFHLTLRFLGNVAIDQIDALTNKLRLACRAFDPLQVRAAGIGFFPERGFPRVIWTGVLNKDKQLSALQSAIQSATMEFTTERAEKEFASHITLGRARKIRRCEAEILTRFAEKMRNRVFGEWTANNVELFRSELLPDGAHHTLMNTTPFGSQDSS